MSAKTLSLLLLGIGQMVTANLLIEGIMKETVDLLPNSQEYIGFMQSALNGTEVELRIKCAADVDVDFEVRYVVRSSPCAKEFFVDKTRFNQVRNYLAFYFNEASAIPEGYNYNLFWYYQSKPFKFNCKDANGDLFAEPSPMEPMELRNVTKASKKNESIIIRSKRDTYPGLNRDTIDGGAKLTLTSWHPAQRLPVDAAYLLVVRVTATSKPANGVVPKVDIEAQWRGPHGYLSAIDYPLLGFYGFMTFFYIGLSLSWLIVCLKHWRDLLRIQFWIGFVIIAGLLEKTLFYAEYANMNDVGVSHEGLIEVAELVSCLKRTVAHMLVIIVSVGYGVVKPRLGSTMNQVVMVGCLYFLLCAIEGLTRVSMHSTVSMKEKQVAKVPLAFLEVLIAWWVFTSLVNTMRALRLRRNEVKLSLYRHFTNVLALALGVSVVFMMWSLYIHIFQRCMSDWKELWIDTAFWHVFFCIILTMIMILWRPSQNNQRYAFTPLLDDSEDENDAEDVLISQSPIYDELKLRNVERKDDSTKHDSKKSNIGDELDWIERNIPSSIADALVDDAEEKEQRALELSKML